MSRVGNLDDPGLGMLVQGYIQHVKTISKNLLCEDVQHILYTHKYVQ